MGRTREILVNAVRNSAREKPIVSFIRAPGGSTLRGNGASNIPLECDGERRVVRVHRSAMRLALAANHEML